MNSLTGRSGSLALYGNDTFSVVIDTDLDVIVEAGNTYALYDTNKWSKGKGVLSSNAKYLADNAIANLEATALVSAGGRLYTIPSGVKAEAKKALAWHKEHHRGGTPVGLNTARILARGGQIGIEKVRHIAKYFPRHEVDKKGKGWGPGEDNFPSNGRIAWALWGGDSAQRWASAIVERENKAKGIKADGYLISDYADQINYAKPELNPFKDAYELDENYGPEFLARVRLDGSGMDRLYKIDINGQTQVWDDQCWQDMGHVDGDIWTYDKALDDPYDTVEKSHVIIDPASAVLMAARMSSNPYSCVSVEDLDEDEASLAALAIPEEDWNMVDQVMVAAAPAPITDAAKGTVNPTDSVYSPAERSGNAAKQVRDATGRFATQGTQVSIKNGQPGTITAINSATKMVTVQHADGSSSVVPASSTKRQEANAPVNPQIPQDNIQIAPVPVDTSGILGEPRTPMSRGTGVQLPGTLPALTRDDLHNILSDYPAWVQNQRAAFMPGQGPNPTVPNHQIDPRTPLDKADDKYRQISPSGKAIEKLAGKQLTTNAYSHPLLSKWLSTPGKSPDRSLWYQPITSAAETKPEEKKIDTKVPEAVKDAAKPAPAAKADPNAPEHELTPATSDVKPLYIAVVAPDDPRAVMDLVSLIPASSKSTQPMTYKRENKKWVKDETIIADLNSATPPPVVPLDADTLNDVLLQIDANSVTASALSLDHVLTVLWNSPAESLTSGFAFETDKNSSLDLILESVLAAGGLDRNRGNAEKLRRYWTHGEGAAKIRWGQPGDWKRCVRHLGKYLGVRAKGYCQLRHKEATGMYTATHAKKDRQSHKAAASNQEFIMEEVLTKNYGEPTHITDEDMLMPIEDIMAEHDDLYDDSWQPHPHMVKLLNDQDCVRSMTAAGGLDRNRGNAEELRHYWTVGKGAAKIRWNTPGDWTRCVRHLGKYLGPRAKGYCALRHKEVTGMWTGDQKHRQMYGHKHGRKAFSTDFIKSAEAVIEGASLTASVNKLKNRIALTAAADQGECGASFHMPLVIPEGVESGDGRKFRKGSILMRELPLPLMWQIQTGDGHLGSVVVGRIDRMERTDDGIGNAYGVFDTGEHGREAERLVKNGFIRGISADMDQFEAKEDSSEAGADGENDDEVSPKKLTINKARVMGVTIVPKPAFQECKIFIVDDNNKEPESQEEHMIPDGIYVDDSDTPDSQALVACGIVAGAIPVVPPTEWFDNPKLSKATPLTVDDSGRVFGHIASWDVDHIGLAHGTKPPRSKSNYAYFHTGVVRTDSGKDVPVGQLTLAGGHASLEASAMEAVKHYDDTASAIADVHAGEDQFGIWVAGALRPDAQPEQVRALRASAPSGDWRPIRNSLELVAVCQVNVPGFPIARARVASGAVMALVAAGARPLAELKAHSETDLEAQIASARARFAELAAGTETEEQRLTARLAELSSRVKGEEFAYDDMFTVSRQERKSLARKGLALPDGSYPIRNEGDLKNAIQSYGRAKNKAATRRHIEKRARAMGKADLIPENWGEGSASNETSMTAGADLRARVAAAQDRLGKANAVEPILNAEDVVNPFAPVVTPDQVQMAEEVPAAAPVEAPDAQDIPTPKELEKETKSVIRESKYTAKTQPRDSYGKFRRVLARLKQNLGVAGLTKLQKEVAKIEGLNEIGDYGTASASAAKLIDTVDRLDSGALNNVSLENIRTTTTELGKVIANLPLPFSDEAQKVRYSDLPPALKNLMDDMITRVEDKIGKKDADVATADLKSFKSGADVYNQAEISSQMNKLLRLLT